MCGINGIISKEKDKDKLIKEMNKRIVHRGPDAEGIYIDDNVALGQRRLSIIDLEGGNQPIYNKDKSKIASLALVLVAGGAIGNCIDRLFRGYVVDMLSFNFFGYSFPVFNFADICVVIGAVLLVVSLCFTKEGK